MKKTLRLALTALAVVLCATIAPAKDAEVVMGAARTAAYVPLLKGKRIALLSNMTGSFGLGQHLHLQRFLALFLD